MFHDNPIDFINRQKLRYLDFFSSKGYTLIVCIENYDDERFWSFIFSKIENLKPKFIDFDGKKNILPFKEYFDKEFVACVDSDYDYILKKSYLENPYIFHTYVYAVENYCLCLNTLNDLKVSCNISTSLDLKSLLKKISLILKEALFYDIYLKDSNQECQREVFNFKNISIENLNESFILNHLEVQVNSMLNGINKSVFSTYENTISNKLCLHEDFLYLYIEGHIIFDSFLYLLKKLQIQSSQLRREKIHSKYSGQLRGDKLKEIKNKEFDIESILRVNYKEAYQSESSYIHQIIKDINHALGVS